jgi:hypothetical protein
VHADNVVQFRLPPTPIRNCSQCLDLADSPRKIVIHVIGFSGSNSKVVSAKYYFLDPPLDGGGIASIYREGPPVGYVRRYDTVRMSVAEGVSLDVEACAHNKYNLNKRMPTGTCRLAS